MELEPKEQKLIQTYIREGQSGKWWPWMFFTFGGLALVAGLVACIALSAENFSSGERSAFVGLGLIWSLTGIYLIDAGIYERRQQRVSNVISKLINQLVAGKSR